jgi:tyrosine-protein phosphatase non-receptor type 23
VNQIQGDDVSHILLLHRKGSSFEPSLFSHELEKFKPFQQRVAQSIQLQQAVLQDVSQKWKSLKGAASKGPGTRKYEEKERRKMEVVRRFARARESWVEVTEGLA